jgi:hypothetical protein
MKTKKEKAKDLVDRFLDIKPKSTDKLISQLIYDEAKQGALICVDEMKKNIIWSSDFNGAKRKELESIEQEIKNL